MAKIPTHDTQPYRTGFDIPYEQRDAEPSIESDMMSYIYGKVKYFHTHKKAKLVYYEDIYKARHYEVVNKKGLIIAEAILPIGKVREIMSGQMHRVYPALVINNRAYKIEQILADIVIQKLNDRVHAHKWGGIIPMNKEEYRKKYFGK